MVGPGVDPDVWHHDDPSERAEEVREKVRAAAPRLLRERIAAGMDINVALHTWQKETFGPTGRSGFNLDGPENIQTSVPNYCC